MASWNDQQGSTLDGDTRRLLRLAISNRRRELVPQLDKADRELRHLYEPPRVGKLTAVEARIIALAAEGYEMTEIAEHRGLALETVKTHLKQIRRKLDARNTTHAVALWLTVDEEADDE